MMAEVPICEHELSDFEKYSRSTDHNCITNSAFISP